MGTMFLRKVVVFVFVFSAASAWAKEYMTDSFIQPPALFKEQKTWLFKNLASDLDSTPVGEQDISRIKKSMPPIINGLDSEQAGVSVRYYALLREKSKRDAEVIKTLTEEARENKKEIAQIKKELSAQMQSKSDELIKLSLLMAEKSRTKMLGELIYVTVPGWCSRVLGDIPIFYFEQDGSYVGPLSSSNYAGRIINITSVSFPTTTTVISTRHHHHHGDHDGQNVFVDGSRDPLPVQPQPQPQPQQIVQPQKGETRKAIPPTFFPPVHRPPVNYVNNHGGGAVLTKPLQNFQPKPQPQIMARPQQVSQPRPQPIARPQPQPRPPQPAPQQNQNNNDHHKRPAKH